MVSENAEKNDEENKTERKVGTPKAKACVAASCTKLHELFCCQKFAHSVIFYVLIFLLLIVLLYIFRKLVSLPVSNGRYQGRKHNTNTTSTESRNSNNDSKWQKLNPISGRLPTTLLGSTDLTSQKEKKTRVYGVPGSGSQEYSGFSNNYANSKLEGNAYDNSYTSSFKSNYPTTNQYSSSLLNNNIVKTNEEQAANRIGNNGYGSPASGVLPSSDSINTQNDWSSRAYNSYSGFKPYDTNWENSWNTKPWGANSNSASDLTKISQKSPLPTVTPEMNNYGTWGASSRSWAKWGQPGSGFGWIKTAENNNVNSYRSPTASNWNNYYYDNASGKWGFNNNNMYGYKSQSSPQNVDSSNSYSTPKTQIASPYSWTPYAENWGNNNTQNWNNYDSSNRNWAVKVNDKKGRNNNSSELEDDNDDRIHRWPMEEDKSLHKRPVAVDSRKRKNRKRQGKRKKKARNQRNRKFQHERKDKVDNINHKHSVKKYKSEISNQVKKSKIPHPGNLKSTVKGSRKNWQQRKLKKDSSKQFSRKLSLRKTRLPGTKHSKYENTIVTSHKKVPKENTKIGEKHAVGKDMLGKWQRKVHHVKHCKKLRDFQTNGKVRLDRKYLHRQRKYKYTVLSCRYIRTQNSQKKKKDRDHLDDDHDDDDHNLDGDNDDGDEDEIPFKRKQICRKFWFITNGKILLQKTYMEHDQSNYKVLLCRESVEPSSKKEGKIRTFNFKTTPSPLDEDDYQDLNIVHKNEIKTQQETMHGDVSYSEKDKQGGKKANFDDDNELSDEEDMSGEGSTSEQTQHTTTNKVSIHQNISKIYTEDDDDGDNDLDIDKMTNRKSKIGFKYDDDNDLLDTETDSDIDGNTDIGRTGEQNKKHKNIMEDVDENVDLTKKTDETFQHENREPDDADFETKAEQFSSHRSTGNKKTKKNSSAGKTKPKNQDDDLNSLDIDDISDSDNDIDSEQESSKANSHGLRGKKKYDKKHKIHNGAGKTTQYPNDGDLDRQDVDGIDDLDDSIGDNKDDNIMSVNHEGSTIRQRPQHKARDEKDNGLDNDKLDDDFDDDMDNDDIMDVTHDTTSHPQQTTPIGPLNNARKYRNKLKPTKPTSTNKLHNKNDVYERLLHELTKESDVKDKSNDRKKLLASILKQKFEPTSSPKQIKSKIPQPKSTGMASKNVVNRKRKQHFQPGGVPNGENISNLLKNMLNTNSIDVKSLSQVLKAQSETSNGGHKRKEKEPKTTTPKPSTKPSMKDLLKQIFPNVVGLPNQGKTTSAPTRKPTKASTTPDQKENVQFANLLKKFTMQNNRNVQAKKVSTVGGSSKTHMDDLLEDSSAINMPKSQYTNPVTQGLGVTQDKLLAPPPESPPKLVPQPSPSPQTLLPQKQQIQQQTTASFNPSYLNPNPYQEQVNAQRSFIPKSQQTAEISQQTRASIPQPAQQQVNGYAAYSPNNNNNPYGSYRKEQSTNILCFGDSLTSGYYDHGRGKHPYSIRLNQLLNPAGSHHYHIETRGVVGEMVHGSMTKRLPKILNEGTHYDWVFILGGTNDVAHVKNFGDDQDFTSQLISVWSPKIVKDIEKLHETARSHGARTLLMTIPETAYELWPAFRSIRNMRLSVNAALRKYATEVSDSTVLCDLAYKLPRSTLSTEMQRFYWNDHIHLNPVGYNKMAEIIEQCVHSYLTK